MADTDSREQRSTVVRIWKEVTCNKDFLATYMPHSGDHGRDTLDPLASSWVFCESTEPTGTTPTEPPAKRPHKGHASIWDTEDLPNGPFRILANKSNHRTHALTTEDKTICGWRPRLHTHLLLESTEDWQAIHNRATLCKHCYKHFTLPDGWAKPLHADSGTSANTSSTSQDSDAG